MTNGSGGFAVVRFNVGRTRGHVQDVTTRGGGVINVNLAIAAAMSDAPLASSARVISAWRATPAGAAS